MENNEELMITIPLEEYKSMLELNIKYNLINEPIEDLIHNSEMERYGDELDISYSEIEKIIKSVYYSKIKTQIKRLKLKKEMQEKEQPKENE